MSRQALRLSRKTYLLLGGTVIVFGLEAAGLVLKLVHRNEVGWLDGLSAMILVLALVAVMACKRPSEDSDRQGPRFTRVITVLCGVAIVAGMASVVTMLAVSGNKGIPHATEPILAKLPQYELFSHGRITQVSRPVYITVAVCLWTLKSLLEVSFMLGLILRVTRPQERVHKEG